MLELLRGIGEEVVGSGKDGCIYIDDAVRRMEALSEEAPGSVSLIYMDPPYGTGKRFEVRQKVGAREWKSGRGSLVLPAYDDKLPRDEYLSMMRSVLTSSKKLLSSDGLLFIHVDYRMHAHVRLLADEIFGESSFLNEIVVIECREDHNLAQVLGNEDSSRFYTVHYGHLDIHESDVARGLARQVDCFFAVGCTSDDIEVIVYVEDDLHPVSYEIAVINYQYFDRIHLHSPSSSRAAVSC